MVEEDLVEVLAKEAAGSTSSVTIEHCREGEQGLERPILWFEGFESTRIDDQRGSFVLHFAPLALSRRRTRFKTDLQVWIGSVAG